MSVAQKRARLIVAASALVGIAACGSNAKPMDDRYYRHLLFGESGQYIPELDGLR